MKKFILNCISIIGKNNILSVLKFFSRVSRKLALWAHKLQMKFEWKVPPQPEWFDHFCDQYYSFRTTKNPLWAERGIFNLLAIRQNASVLELCCGDGFNTCHFYSGRVQQIKAVDFDKLAIPHAKKYNQAPNIEFSLCDIRYNMPGGEADFDNIIWDAAIEHFTQEEIDKIVFSIKKRLKFNGIVSGYTIMEKDDGTKSLSHHEYEFKSKADLRRFFEPHFKNVKVFETIYPSRTNLYFYASDGPIPFDEGWEGMTHIKK